MQWGHFERAARFLEQRDMDLVQPPDQKSRSLGQRPRLVDGLVAARLGLWQRSLSLCRLLLDGAGALKIPHCNLYGTDFAFVKYEVCFVFW